MSLIFMFWAMTIAYVNAKITTFTPVNKLEV